MIRFCLLCVFLFRSFSGSAEVPMNRADSLFGAANYSCAALEYEWVNYENTDNTTKAVALLKKSYCYKKLENFNLAAFTLNRIKLNDLSDSLQFRIRSEHALLCYLNGNLEEANSYLSEINFYSNDSLRNTLLYLNILNKNEMQKWHETDSLLHKYIELNRPLIDSSKLASLFQKPKLLNKKTAKTLSYILPGSGQMYTGNIFRGLSSIGFQGALALYTFLSIQNGFYFIGITSGIATLSMFYKGGAKYAAFLAEKKNTNRINDYNQKLKEFVLAIEKSKPK
jgi:hypothetical protein